MRQVSRLRAIQFAGEDSSNASHDRLLDHRQMVSGDTMEDKTVGREVVPTKTRIEVAATGTFGGPDMDHSPGKRMRAVMSQSLSGLGDLRCCASSPRVLDTSPRGSGIAPSRVEIAPQPLPETDPRATGRTQWGEKEVLGVEHCDEGDVAALAFKLVGHLQCHDSCGTPTRECIGTMRPKALYNARALDRHFSD